MSLISTLFVVCAVCLQSASASSWSCNLVLNPIVSKSEGSNTSTTTRTMYYSGGYAFDACEPGDGFLVDDTDSGKFVCEDNEVKFQVFSGSTECSGSTTSYLIVNATEFECNQDAPCKSVTVFQEEPSNYTKPSCDETTGVTWTSPGVVTDLCVPMMDGNYSVTECTSSSISHYLYADSQCSGDAYDSYTFQPGCNTDVPRTNGGVNFQWDCDSVDPVAETTDNPSETTDTPSETTDTPSETTDTPSETTDTPSETTDTPSAPSAGNVRGLTLSLAVFLVACLVYS